MFCQLCGLDEAKITRVVNTGFGKAKVYLCEACAGKIDERNRETAESLGMDKRCPFCGSTYSDIANSLYVGCAECYQTFKTEIEGQLFSMQGKSDHVGKRPDGRRVNDLNFRVAPVSENDLKRKVNAKKFNRFNGGQI